MLEDIKRGHIEAARLCLREYTNVQYSPLNFSVIITNLLEVIDSMETKSAPSATIDEARANELANTFELRWRDWALEGGKDLQIVCHTLAATSGWWTNLKTGEDLRLANNVPEKLMLIVSELGEAMEGHRKDLMDDKLPHRKMLEVELADAVIRIFDLAGAKGMDLGGAIAEKLAYNQQRADHKPEVRLAAGGKQY